MKIIIATNSRFAKAGVSCFYESEVLNSSIVHLMKYSAENPRLRKAAKHYRQGWKTPTDNKTVDNFETILRHTINLKSNFAK